MAIQDTDLLKKDILGEDDVTLSNKINELAGVVSDPEALAGDVLEAQIQVETTPMPEETDVAVLGLSSLKNVFRAGKEEMKAIKETGPLPTERPEMPIDEVGTPVGMTPELESPVTPEDQQRYLEALDGNPDLSGAPRFNGTRLDIENIKTHEDFAAHFSALSEISRREVEQIGNKEVIQQALNRGWTQEELEKFVDPKFKADEQTWSEAIATSALMNMKAADYHMEVLSRVDEAGGIRNADPALQAEFLRSLDYANTIRDSFGERASDTGRALQMLNSIEFANVSMDKEYMQIIKNAGGENALELIYNASKRAKTPQERGWVAKARAAGTRGLDMLMYNYYNSMLSSPDTMQRILVGNIGLTALRAAERPIASAYGYARYYGRKALGLDANRPISLNELVMNYAALPAAMADAWRMFPKTFKANQQQIGIQRLDHETVKQNPFEFEVKDDDTQFTKVMKAASKGYGLMLSPVNRGIMGMDDSFKAFNMRIELTGLAARKADVEYMNMIEGGMPKEQAREISNNMMKEWMAYPSEDMWSQALQLSEEITLTNKLSGGFKMLENWTKDIPLLKIWLPFVRSPANMIARTSEYIPLVQLGVKRFREDLFSEGPAHDIAMARFGLGLSAGMSLIPMLANNEDPEAEMGITGGMMYDEDERKVRMARNEQPFSVWYKKSMFSEEELAELQKDPSFTIGTDKVYRSYLGYEPASAIAAAWATAGEYMAYNDDEDFNQSLVTSLAEGTAMYLKDVPMISQLGNFYDSYIFRDKNQGGVEALVSEAGRGVVDFAVRSTPAGAYSGLLGYIDRLYEPEKWQTTASTEEYPLSSEMARNVMDVINQHRVNNPMWRAFHEDGKSPKINVISGDQVAKGGDLTERMMAGELKSRKEGPEWMAIYQTKAAPPRTPKKLQGVVITGEQKYVWENALNNEAIKEYIRNDNGDLEEVGSAFGGRNMREELARIAESQEFKDLVSSSNPEDWDDAKTMVTEVYAAAKKHAEAQVRSSFSNINELIKNEEVKKQNAKQKYMERILREEAAR